MPPTFFKTAAGFRRWLAKNHASAPELLIGFYRKNSGSAGLTYAEAVDEALCFGWIDGIKKRLDEVSYTHRFTPRRPRSIWSLVNIKHVERLVAAGRMMPAGTRAFAARESARTGVYAFEKELQQLDDALEKTFRANRSAWKFWLAQPPGYRKNCIHWVMGAKQAATRERRLAQLIADSATGVRLGMGSK
jgi:uncharacterized protein YdeI (YjbR/CyaY-like superfamily)